jgi:class I lanthipeptide synthase
VGWKPILTGELRARALHVAQNTLVDLSAAEHREEPAALDDHGPRPFGAVDCGRAFAFAYGARAGLGDELEDSAAHALDVMAERLGTHQLSPFLFGGVPEVGFAAAHLADAESTDAICGLCDHVVARHLEVAIWDRDFDLIRGLVGFGVYALERVDGPAGRACAARVLGHLEARAEPRLTGLAWHSAPELMFDWQRARYPKGHYNLGLAHGIPGVLALLARFVHHDLEAGRARALLEGGLRYLRAAVPPRDGARFPTHVVDEGDPQPPTRLAWCYGDLGVAVALLWAARALRDPAIEAAALDLALRSTTRRTIAREVFDAGVCHGASGIAHLYNRLYQATHDERFAEAARFWIEATLGMRTPGSGLGGFSTPHRAAPGEALDATADPRLLTGAAGIALVLISAATDLEPSWDRLLLCDVPLRTATGDTPTDRSPAA